MLSLHAQNTRPNYVPASNNSTENLQKLLKECEFGGEISYDLITTIFSQNNSNNSTQKAALVILNNLSTAAKANLPLFENACDDYINLILTSTRELIESSSDLPQIGKTFDSLIKSDPFEYLAETTKQNWFNLLNLVLDKLPTEFKATLPFEKDSCSVYISSIKDSMKSILRTDNVKDKSAVLAKLAYLSKNENLPMALRTEFAYMIRRATSDQQLAKL